MNLGKIVTTYQTKYTHIKNHAMKIVEIPFPKK